MSLQFRAKLEFPGRFLTIGQEICDFEDKFKIKPLDAESIPATLPQIIG
jgi:hypothetical protein